MLKHNRFVILVQLTMIVLLIIFNLSHYNEKLKLEEELVDKTIEISEMKDLYRLQIELIDKMTDKLKGNDSIGN